MSEALAIYEACLAEGQRRGDYEGILKFRSSIAICLEELGRSEEALRIKMEIYTQHVKILGTCHESTLIAALNLSQGLITNGNCTAAAKFLRDRMPEDRRVFEKEDVMMLRFRDNYALSLFKSKTATPPATTWSPPSRSTSVWTAWRGGSWDLIMT